MFFTTITLSGDLPVASKLQRMNPMRETELWFSFGILFAYINENMEPLYNCPGRTSAIRRLLVLVVSMGVSLATPARAPACTLTTTGAVSVLDGELFTLNLSASGGTPTSWTINWGDGTIETFPGNPASVTHTYSAAIPSMFTYNILASAVCGGNTYFQNDLAVASSRNDEVNWYAHDAATNIAVTRAPVTSGPDFGLLYPQGVIVGRDGNVYVSGWDSGNVVRYNPTTGAAMDEFATGGTAAAGMAFGPDGNLYVADPSARTVRRYNGTTGAFIDLFVTAGLGGLDEAEGLAFGPDGHLYVSDFRNDGVYRYNGSTGAFIDEFVAAGDLNLRDPEDIVFGPDGNSDGELDLYVANDGNHNVVRYQGPLGASPGTFINEFVAASAGRNAQGIGFGPDGRFYVGSWGNDTVERFNGTTGAYIDNYVTAQLGGLRETTYYAFIPGHQVMVIAATAVELVSLNAVGLDGAVELTWETGSEMDNLGFHLYRSLSEEGPYERITASLIPGLGSSPAGARYRYVDTGLANGVPYFYELEDIETTGKLERHGPVSSTPTLGASEPVVPPVDEPVDENASSSVITYGDPEANDLRVVKRGRYEVVLELTTEGFLAYPEPDGSVRIEIPDYLEVGENGLPQKRTWVEALAGRQVELVSIRTHEIETFGLRPSGSEYEIVATPDGVVRLERRARRGVKRKQVELSESARLVSVAFQGEVKKALVEMAPLSWDASRQQLRLAKKLVVTLSFAKRNPDEVVSPDGRRGRLSRRRGKQIARGGVVARLGTQAPGLYAVRYEEIFGRRSRGRRVYVDAARLRLARLGETVAYHLRPAGSRFGPGSTLYFVSPGAEANPYGDEAVFELELGVAGGARMEVEDASPSGAVTRSYLRRDAHEQNRIYQAALFETDEHWMWDSLFAPAVKGYGFSVSAPAPGTDPARLELWLQGGSDFPESPDHHVVVYLNGTRVAERSWDGKVPQALDVEMGPGVLREGDNLLEVENVGDTGAAYSMVFVDRYAVTYPRLAMSGRRPARGTMDRIGHGGVSRGCRLERSLVDTTGAQPVWLAGASTSVVQCPSFPRRGGARLPRRRRRSAPPSRGPESLRDGLEANLQPGRLYRARPRSVSRRRPASARASAPAGV